MLPTKITFYKYSLIILSILCNNVTYAEIYKWIDKNGTTHYGQKPISGIDQEEISQKIKQSSEAIKFAPTKSFSSGNQSTKQNSGKLFIDIKSIQYSIDSRTRKQIKRQIRSIYQAYTDWFGWDTHRNQKIKIRIFGKYKDFENYQIKSKGKFTTHRSHYNRKNREILMHGTEFKDATLGVLYHEASHAIIHMGMNSTPKWINEGLAEVFELSEISKGTLTTKNNDEWVERIKHKLREGSLLSFKDYINITSKSWHNTSRREERAYYYIAWSMMKFLVSNKKRRIALKDIIHETRRTAWWEKKALENIFNNNYPGGINKLNRDWRKWITQQS